MPTVLGYDPGGNQCHGVAAIIFDSPSDPCLVRAESATMATAEDSISWFMNFRDVKAIGIDTLTKWSTGPSGWRPADRWLQERYSALRRSIVAPNSLSGSMVLAGMSIIKWYVKEYPGGLVTETHPKILYFALTQNKYDWVNRSPEMVNSLSSWLKCEVQAETEHAFDALVSAYACLEYYRGNWTNDLHELPSVGQGRDIVPFGNSKYVWPPND